MFLIPHNSIAKLRNGKASLVDNYVNLLPSAFYISIIVLPIHRQPVFVPSMTNLKLFINRDIIMQNL